MDTEELERVLTKMLDRTKIANQVGPELDEFSSEELLDWPVNMQMKLADVMGVEVDNVDVKAEPEVSEKMQDFLTAENPDGDQLAENMEEFLGA